MSKRKRHYPEPPPTDILNMILPILMQGLMAQYLQGPRIASEEKLAAMEDATKRDIERSRAAADRDVAGETSRGLAQQANIMGRSAVRTAQATAEEARTTAAFTQALLDASVKEERTEKDLQEFARVRASILARDIPPDMLDAQVREFDALADQVLGARESVVELLRTGIIAKTNKEVAEILSKNTKDAEKRLEELSGKTKRAGELGEMAAVSFLQKAVPKSGDFTSTKDLLKAVDWEQFGGEERGRLVRDLMESGDVPGFASRVREKYGDRMLVEVVAGVEGFASGLESNFGEYKDRAHTTFGFTAPWWSSVTPEEQALYEGLATKAKSTSLLVRDQIPTAWKKEVIEQKLARTAELVSGQQEGPINHERLAKAVYSMGMDPELLPDIVHSMNTYDKATGGTGRYTEETVKDVLSYLRTANPTALEEPLEAYTAQRLGQTHAFVADALQDLEGFETAQRREIEDTIAMRSHLRKIGLLESSINRIYRRGNMTKTEERHYGKQLEDLGGGAYKIKYDQETLAAGLQRSRTRYDELRQTMLDKGEAEQKRKVESLTELLRKVEAEGIAKGQLPPGVKRVTTEDGSAQQPAATPQPTTSQPAAQPQPVQSPAQSQPAQPPAQSIPLRPSTPGIPLPSQPDRNWVVD